MKKRAVGLLLIATMLLTACGKTGKVYTKVGSDYESTVEKLGTYKGLSYEYENISVTEEEVEEEIQSDLDWYTDYAEIDRTTIENGDVVNIDFVGTIDGEEFESGSAKEYDIVIGAGEFIDGFEEQLIGMKKGEKGTIEVTFPDTYDDEELAGANAVFDVTINKIQEEVETELTEEFVKENYDFDTIEEYRNYMKEELVSSKKEEQDSNASMQLLQSIVESTTFNIVDSDVESVAQNMEEEAKYYAEMYGMEFSEFLDMFYGETEENFPETCKSEAIEQIKTYLVLDAIVLKENLGYTQKEYKEAASEMYVTYGYESLESFEADYSAEEIAASLLYDKAIGYLLECNKKSS